MIAINTVLIPIDASEQTLITESCVVVYGDQLRDKVFVINLKGRAKKPIALPYSLLLEWLNGKIIGLATLEKPTYFQLSDNLLPEKTVLKREARWRAILPLTSHLEEFLMADYGSKLVSDTARKAEKTRDQIYQWFYQYLRLGQTKTAVTPNYTLTGSVPRAVANKKIGAPRVNDGEIFGKNITEEDKAKITKILNKHYWLENGMSLSQCLVELNLAYYAEGKTISQTGEIKVTLKPENERVSINQLRYWEVKIANKEGINSLAKRTGKTRHKKDLLGRTGNPEVAHGPGHIYQIDATVLDFEAVSSFSKDRTLMVGRPIIYWVRDVFSGAFVGLHVSLSSASWHTMRLALFNTFRDKKSYCLEHGVEISDDDWPQQGYCTKLVGDNAELTSDISESILKDCGIVVRFGREYRGDDKGLIEQAFNLQNLFLKGRVPGYVPKTAGDRGTINPKLFAKLTVKEMTQILIDFAIHFNKTTLINANNLDKSVVSSGIQLTPNAIWEWGLKNRPFNRKAYDDKNIYLNLLEAGEVTLTRKGLVFRGLIYRSSEIQQAGLQDRKLSANKSIKIECRFMRHNMNHIWLLLPQGKVKASLATRSRRFQDCSFEEIEKQLQQEKLNGKQLSQVQAESAASLSLKISTMVKKATSEQGVVGKRNLSKQLVSKNKAVDIKAENSVEAAIYEQHSSDNNPESLEGIGSDEIQKNYGDNPEGLPEKNKSLDIYESTMQQLLKGDEK
jgi:hypothetical protein